MDRSDKLFALLVVVGLTAAIFLALGRAGVERSNRAVEIIVDADDVRQLAMAGGVPFSQALNELRTAGATALAVREVTVGELVALGEVLPLGLPGATSLVSPDPSLLAALAVALHAKLPQVEIGLVESGTPAVVVREMAMDQLAKVPVLLRPEDIQEARGAGLRLVGRLMNFNAASPEAVKAAAEEAKAAGARLIVFREDQVLGFHDLLGSAAEAFDKSDLLYGYVEIVSQKGGDTLAAKLPHRLIRVHSITDADMLTISPESAVARYERAVEERNIRACYVRLIVRPQPDPVANNARYVANIANTLRGGGFRIGPPAPFAAPSGWPPAWARALVLFALPAALVLLLRRLAPIGPAPAWATFVSALILGAALVAAKRSLVVPVSGLAAACIFPALSLVWAMQWSRASELGLRAGKLTGRAVIGLLVTCAITLVGAMLIVGLYSPVRYLEGVGVFTGVKLAYLAPLVLAFAVAVADAPGRAEPLGHWWARVRLRSLRFFRQPITMVIGAVLLIALAALAFAVSRSGNQPAVAPTGGELRLRGLLESLLFVRPRTKEFLLGHPALMLLIALSLRGRRAWLPLVAVLAGIGQISLLNTFCHFHSPLHIGFLRTANGIWLGAIVGVVVVVVWRLILDRRPRLTEP